MRGVCAATVFWAMTWLSAAQACEVAGRYRVDGVQAGGGRGYSGEAEITPSNGQCAVRWLPPNTSSGRGDVRNGELEVRFGIGGATGTVVYKILPGGVLDGRWWLDRSPQKIGQERLTPLKAQTTSANPMAAGTGRLAQMASPERGTSLKVRMRNIDDIGLVLVATPDAPLSIVGGAEWTAQNGGGAATVDLGGRLKQGRNLVALLIHDKRFAFGGKWAFDFELVIDGSPIWSQRQSGGTRGAGIKWWTAFSVEKQSNGTLVVEPASVDQLDALGVSISAMNSRLVRDYGEERTVLGLVAGALALGIASDLLGGSGASGPRNCREVVISGTPSNAKTIVRCD